TASIEFGGIIAKASPVQLELLRQFGSDIGLAFQIIDDVIDLTASEQKHKKAMPSDQASNKTTYATMLGIASARQAAYASFDQAQQWLKQLNCNTLTLSEFSKHLIYREI